MCDAQRHMRCGYYVGARRAVVFAVETDAVVMRYEDGKSRQRRATSRRHHRERCRARSDHELAQRAYGG